MKLAALWAGRIGAWLSRKLGFNGTNIPGLIGLKLDRWLLKKLARQVDRIVVVTGTNGKTTTNHLLYQIFQASGMKTIANIEGSNLNTGITSVFMKHADWLGRIRGIDAAVIELDEGNLPFVLKDLSPKGLIVTNFFRDQLDRYAEIDQLINKIKAAITEVGTPLFLNADDPLTVRLAEDHPSVTYYGMAKDAYSFHDQSLTESKYCQCGKPLYYSAVHYGQLGFYECPSCGFHRPDPSTLIQRIDNHSTVSVQTDGHLFTSHLKGAYNAYNIAAALCCAKTFGLNEEVIQQGLNEYVPDNGRMENFTINARPYMLNLSKNAQGVNSTLTEFLKTTEPKQFILALNDLEADGQDVSWIWDAHYEQLNRPDVEKIICTGRRAFDLAIRLKYAGIDPSLLQTVPTLKNAINESMIYPGSSYLICNYTTLKPTRDLLAKHENIRMNKELV